MKFPKWHQIEKLVFDFDGVFTNNKVLVNYEGEEFVVCDRGDGLAINFLKSFKKYNSWDLEVLVLTKERNKVVLSRCNKLGIRCINAIDDKAAFLKNQFRDLKINNFNQIQKLMYVGNDLNDLEAFNVAEFSCAPIDAHELIKKKADYILPVRGGEGFVRNLVERLLDFENKTEEEIIEIMGK